MKSDDLQGWDIKLFPFLMNFFILPETTLINQLTK
jgi:hypothetical protein